MLCLKAMLLQIDLSVTITLVPLGVFLFLQLKDFREWSLLDIRGGLVLSIEVLSWIRVVSRRRGNMHNMHE